MNKTPIITNGQDHHGVRVMEVQKRHIALIIIGIIAVVSVLLLYMYTLQRQAPDLLSLNPKIPMNIALRSPAINYGKEIPVKYTCDGADVSPPLNWTILEENPNIKSLLIVMFDPDAPHGTFIHWLIYNIPVNTKGLPENIPPLKVIAQGVQARNDFGKIGYAGPCPPPGTVHRYYIRIYALDTMLSIKSDDPRTILEKASKHVIIYGELMGTYKRKQ